MKRYVLAPKAERDLEQIWDYIADDSEDAAHRWIAKLRNAMEMLAASPGSGHTRLDLPGENVLFWPVDAYLIVYRRQQTRIRIVAVVYGARNIPAFLSRRKNA